MSISRRTASGRSSATRSATTPPVDWPTRSTGASIARCASRTRSSKVLTSGEGGTLPSPGQSSAVVCQCAGSRRMSGFQKPPSPPEPGRNTTQTIR